MALTFCFGKSMTPSRVPLALVLMMVAVLLAAGCAGQTGGDGISTAPHTIPLTPSTLIGQPDQTLCPMSSVNTTPYIVINPVSDHIIGDVFEINGTTNLESDSMIKIEIYQSHFYLEPKNVPHVYTGLSGNATIHRDNCGMNAWSFRTNSSVLSPAKYSLIVSAENIPIKNLSEFSLFPSNTS
jgi:hypothetical protein